MPAARTLVVLALLLAGCAAAPAPPREAVAGATLPSSVVLSADAAYCLPLWRREAERRFPNAFILICHGRDDRGRWVMTPDGLPPMPVESVAALLHQLIPGR